MLPVRMHVRTVQRLLPSTASQATHPLTGAKPSNSRAFSSLPGHPPEDNSTPPTVRQKVKAAIDATKGPLKEGVNAIGLAVAKNISDFANDYAAHGRAAIAPCIDPPAADDGKPLQQLQQSHPHLVNEKYLKGNHAPQYHLDTEQFAALLEHSPVARKLADNAQFHRRGCCYQDAFESGRELTGTGHGGAGASLAQEIWESQSGVSVKGYTGRPFTRDEILRAIQDPRRGFAVVVGVGQLTAADSRQRLTENGSWTADQLAQGGIVAPNGEQGHGLIVLGHGGAFGESDHVVLYDQDPFRPVYSSLHDPDVGAAASARQVPPDFVHNMFRLVHVDALLRETRGIGFKSMLLVPEKAMLPIGGPTTAAIP